MADYDENAAIEAALAASLETAMSDEKRRRDKYGIISAIPVVPDSAYRQNRPSSFAGIQQPGSDRSLQMLNIGQWATASGALGSRSHSTESPTSSVTSPWPSEKDRLPASDIARPRPRKSAPPGESLYNEFTNPPTWTPINTMPTHPPLPSVPPNAKNSAPAEYAQTMPRSHAHQRPMKATDTVPRRDVKSSGNTPVHSSRPPSRPPPVKPKVDVSQKTNADHDGDNLITLSPVGSKKDPFDFELSELDPLCGNPLALESLMAKQPQMPPRPSSVPTVPTMQARQTNALAARTPYYFDTLSAAPKFVMPGMDMSRALVPVSKPAAIVNSPIIPGYPTVAAISDTSLNMMRPPSVPSNLPIGLPNLVIASAPVSQTPVSSFPSDVGANKSLDIVQQRVRGATGGPGTSHTSSPSTPGLAGGDLMDFTEEKDMEELFSLEAFDPLFSVDLVTPSVEKEPATLFAGTSPQAVQSGVAMPDVIPQPKSEAPDGTGDSVEVETEELQDPFSISMLTNSLEVKRKKYEEERKARESILRKKVDSKPKEVASKMVKRESFSRCNSHMTRGKESTYETLQEFHETADEEIRAFCQMVARLKKMHAADDPIANKGLVISPTLRHPPYKSMSVKLVVHTHLKKEPVNFTCDLNVQCEHVIIQVLLACEQETTSADDYMLKVHGISEYLLNKMQLGSYEYVQQCLKLDQDIKLVLVVVDNIGKGLKRTAEDDKQPVFVPKHRDLDDKDARVTMGKMNILMETFYKEVEKLRDNALKHGCGSVHCKSVVQAVKAICATLCKIETINIITAVSRLETVIIERTLHVSSPKDREAFIYVTEEGDTVGAVYDSEIQRLSEMDDLHLALEDLTQSVKALIELYCRTFHTEFRFESAAHVSREKRDLLMIHETLLIHVASMHRVPLKWRNTYEEFKIITGLYYGGRRICPEVMTQILPIGTENSFQETMIFDEWIQFEPVFLCALPREARLTFTLVGVKTVSADGGQKGTQKINNPLGWVALQVFNHKFELAQGSQLLGLWIGESAYPTGTSQSNTESPSSVLLQVNLPVFDFDVVFPTIEEAGPCLKQEFPSLHPSDQDRLQDILEKDAITRLTPDEAEFLYEKRNYLWTKPEALSKVLMAVPRWDFNTLRETYTMISGWNALSNIQAMELLLPSFADSHVRTMAVKWIGEMTDDQLLDYLPQLIQSLKFECYHNCALARLLLERSIFNIRVAFYLYWYLKEAAEDFRYRKRFQLLFGALLSVAGGSLRKEFSKQEDFTKMLASIADKVRSGKDKEGILRQELVNMFHFMQHNSIRLPLNPSMEVDMQMDVEDTKSCSYFTSNAFPLKLVLKNVDPKAEPIYIMFKIGDDLRQDMLTMQMIRIMDKLWLADGLDLKIITFRCLATGNKKGMVELVTESETLRKIQVKHGHGLAGSFKDRTIAEWLQGQNPTELEYQKAVDNFIASCAGYCVATYVLGICDRHNDNIMIKNSGHLFHIDFGKFLGDSQMFGSIKRDRTPFVLTSDMAYVINGGDKPSHKFQIFVDLCCQAFNILRHHANLFLTLFSMMSRSDIPGVDDNATKYVQKALMPDFTDTEATAFFTRMIEESLKSMFTQINFFFHNLAQMKFSGHQEGALLSFQPKTISMAMDGRIANVEIFGYQKRYNPEKYYIFILKVDRENQRVPSIIFRRYSEFQELHNKLLMAYPLARLPSLPGKVIIGRAHVKTVAEARKAEIEKFLRQLFKAAQEVTESNLVYTFFHPMLRDEQDIDKTNLSKLKEDHKQRRSGRTIQGEIKLSISYQNEELVIMVMHVKDLCGEIGDAPDPYVKIYLLPDPTKMTKRKTKISRGTFHPTFNEVLGYRLPAKEVQERTLQVSVWNYNSLEENEFLGAIFIPLSNLDLRTETKAAWYPLQALHYLNTS